MKTARLLMCLSSILVLNGCVLTESYNDIDGTLMMNSNVTVLDKGGEVTAPLQAGKSYDATIHMASDGSAELNISLAVLKSVSITLPQPFMDGSGAVNVLGSRSKESFDIVGNVSNNTSTHLEEGQEQCVFGERVIRVCHDVPNQVDGHATQGSHTECRDETEIIYGQRAYRGNRVVSTRHVLLNFVDNSQKEIGYFSGSYVYFNDLQDKEILSSCHL